MKHFFFAALLLLSTTLVSAQSASNKTIPAVQVQNLKGEKINISEFTGDGKITAIFFWATWCVPCKKELQNVSKLYKDWKSNYDMEMVAVSIDDSRNRANVTTYVNGQGWKFPVLLDPNQDLKRALNFQTVPYTILLNQEGNIVYTHNSYMPGDEFILEEKIKELIASGKKKPE